MGIKNTVLALGALTQLGGEPDMTKKDPTKDTQVPSEEVVDATQDTREETAAALDLGHDLDSQESPQMALSKAQGILADLKKTHPEVEKAGIDEAVISAIQTLNEGFGEFYEGFGIAGLLTLAASLYFINRGRKQGKGKDSKPELDPETKAKLEEQAQEAKKIAEEMDELVLQPNPSTADKDRLFARASALATGMILTLAPATANAGMKEAWEGVKNAYEGTTNGIGEILNTIGRFSEALKGLSYAIDIITILAIVVGAMITSEDFAKAWKALSNNHIRRNRALGRLVGPRKRKHILFIPTGNTKSGVATDLISRPGAAHGELMARNAGTVLREHVTVRLPNELKAFNKRVRDGEIDIGSLNEHTEQLNELKDQILEILGRDYVSVDAAGAPINVFPQAEYNTLIQRFNALAASLKTSVEQNDKREKLGWKGVGSISAYVLIAALSVGWLGGSVKAHLGYVPQKAEASAPAEAGKPNPDPEPVPVPANGAIPGSTPGAIPGSTPEQAPATGSGSGPVIPEGDYSDPSTLPKDGTVATPPQSKQPANPYGYE